MRNGGSRDPDVLAPTATVPPLLLALPPNLTVDETVKVAVAILREQERMRRATASADDAEWQAIGRDLRRLNASLPDPE